MNININFNRWTTYLILFSPFILIIVLYQLPPFNDLSYGLKKTIEFALLIFGITILYSLQFHLGNSFFKAIDKKALFFKINGLLPLLFWFIACFWYIYHIPAYLKMSAVKRSDSELTSISDMLIYVMLFHFVVTFFFINNFLVKLQLKKVADISLQHSLNTRYFIPMKRVVRISAGLIIGIFICVLIYTLVKNHSSWIRITFD